MDEQLTAQLTASAQQLATAAAALENALAQITAQHEALTTKIDRIVAAIDERAIDNSPALQARIAELERANDGLQAQAARAARKTLPPLVTAILAKSEIGEACDAATLDRALAALSVEQRIAVKAEMARAGLLE